MNEPMEDCEACAQLGSVCEECAWAFQIKRTPEPLETRVAQLEQSLAELKARMDQAERVTRRFQVMGPRGARTNREL